MQLFLNISFQLISFLCNLFSFTSPAWLAELAVGLVKWGIYAQYFVPVLTFLSAAVFCLGVHLSLMVISAILQLI